MNDGCKVKKEKEKMKWWKYQSKYKQHSTNNGCR